MTTQFSETYRAILRWLPAQRRAVVDAALQLGCSQEEAKRISWRADVRTYEAGHLITRLRGYGTTINIIVTGEVVVRRPRQEDAVVGARSVIGELSALRENWYQVADVECLTSVTALVFTADRYMSFAKAGGVVAELVEAARTARVGILEDEREASQLAAWERWQKLKQYVGR
jgi:hypothetical protein